MSEAWFGSLSKVLDRAEDRPARVGGVELDSYEARLAGLAPLDGLDGLGELAGLAGLAGLAELAGLESH